MAKPSLNQLRTPANGQIFALKKPLSDSAVKAAFKAASAQASGSNIGPTVREKRVVDEEDVWLSFVCFPLSGAPAFLPNTDLKEKTYGFLVLVEVEIEAEWYLGVFKHGAASLADWLETRAKQLPRGKLATAFSDGSTVNKMSLQRMTVSKYELRAASYEAADLQSSLPMMAASRCAIRSIRFQDNTFGSIAVMINTSRVQRSGGRCAVEQLAELVIVVAEETHADKSHAFLATFAQAIPIGDLPAGTEPTSLLFDWSALLETDTLELRRQPESGEDLGDVVSKKFLNRILGEPISVVASGDEWQFGRLPHRPLGSFRLTSTKYSVKTIFGNQLVVHDTNTSETVSLTKWARDNDAYSITFSQPEYYFGSGALYHRAGFASEIDMVRRCLQEHPSLATATSEKGEPKKKDSQFPVTSIFGVAENSIYTPRDWICCTDLGDEWADYLCVNGSTLIFIHCKGGKQTTGASSFQEVVGQGLKNLGRIRSTPAEFQEKLAATKRKKYWATTKIERLRDPGRKWSAFEAAVGSLLKNPDANKEVHLVVTMLSKAGFETAAATAPPTPHFIQLIWLLASFINSCREMGAKPVIFCTP